MTSLSDGKDKSYLRIDEYPLCRGNFSGGTHCNAMPWYYVQRPDGLMVPTCRKHVSKMLEAYTGHTFGDAVVVAVGQIDAYLRRANQNNTRGGVEA